MRAAAIQRLGTLPAVTVTGVPPARLGLANQLSRFVLVGGFSFLVDFGVYHGLLALGVWIHLAKALSFVAGTTTAYLINRRWTFTGGEGRPAEFLWVMLLYVSTFVVNVGMNAMMLAVLPQFTGKINVAFVIAQGMATAINFAVQRLVIFKH